MSADRKIIIHAPSVHIGGGLVLLKSLIEGANARDIAFLSLDTRVGEAISIPRGMPYRQLNTSLSGRLAAERELRKRADAGKIVLCFNGLPPLFRLDAYVILFAQNLNIVKSGSLRQFGLKIGSRVAAERLWFRWLSSNVDEYIAQTPSTAAKLRGLVGPSKTVRTLPFLGKGGEVARRHVSAGCPPDLKRYDFVYVASGVGHKNHRKLILAWRILADEGIFPSLCLTLDREHDAGLSLWISRQAEEFGLKIDNAGHLEHSAVIDLYRSSRALLFPSTAESLGLPLIEARQLGLPIIASELDFVRDSVDPEETFDASSELSIARAVKRFLGKEERAASFLGPGEFLAALLARTAR